MPGLKQANFFDEYQQLFNQTLSPTRAVKPKGKPKKVVTPEEKKEKALKTKFPTFALPCTGCPLEPYKKFTEPRGDLRTCRLIVILDKPSMAEMAAGVPFSSQDIKFLEHHLGQIGVKPNEIAYLYALRCGCHDKEIEKEEILRCGNYLLRDLSSSPCRAVLNLSVIGIRYMFQGKSLKTYRGRVVEFNKKQVVCCQSLDIIQKDPIQGSLFQNDLRRLTQVLVGDYTPPNYKYISLTNPDEIVDMCRHLIKIYKPDDCYGWDLETMWYKLLEVYATDCYSEQFKVWQMAFAWEDFTAVSFPFEPDPFLCKKFNLPSIHTNPEIQVAVTELLESCKIIEHTKFDARCMRGKYGVEVARKLPLQQFEDLHAMNYLINPEDLTGNKLKQLTWEYTTEGGYEEGIGFVDDLDKYEWEPNAHYNCHDADLTRRIKAFVHPRMVSMKQDTVYELLLKPINCACLEMEIDGVQMDRDYLKVQQDARQVEMDAALSEFRNSIEAQKLCKFCADKVVELRSLPEKKTSNEKRKHTLLVGRYELPEQPKLTITNAVLAILLYEVLKIPITKMTEDNEPSTDADILDKNTKKFPILKHVLIYKKAQKLHGTYISPYIDGKWSDAKVPKLKNPPHIKIDGKIHPNIKATGARSGRSAMENPNGQNIKNEYEAKRPFITRFVNGKLVSADYSQAEIRMAACQCKDPVLTRALYYDIHTLNLAVIERIANSNQAKAALLGTEQQALMLATECKTKLKELYTTRVLSQLKLGHTKEEFDNALKFYEKIRRTIAKKFMFGPMFGQQERSIIFQLIEEVGLNQAEAERDAPIFLAALKDLYTVYFKWAESNIPEARAVNYVESIFGRRRPLNYVGLLANRSKNDDEIKKQLSGLDRKVTNTKVQGPASDLCLLAGVHLIELFKNKRLSPKQELREKFINDALNGKFYKACVEKGHTTIDIFENFVVKMLEGKALTRTVLPIHDSLTSDCPPDEIIPCAIMTDTVMANTPRYYIDTAGVPFACDLEMGYSLGDVKAFTL